MQQSRFKLLKLWIWFQFPTVRSLSAEDLDRWLQDPTRTPPILLDVRTVPEFTVSHLKTAQRIDPIASRSLCIVRWATGAPDLLNSFKSKALPMCKIWQEASFNGRMKVARYMKAMEN